MNVKVTSGPEDLAHAPDFSQLDSEVWARLSAAPSIEAFAAAWLDIQCRFLGGVRVAAVLLTSDEGKPLSLSAIRPKTAAPTPRLIATAERAASEGRGIVRKADNSGPIFALPVLVDDALRGVVAIEMLATAKTEPARVMRQLQWGAGWLEVLIRRRHPGAREQLVSIIELMSAADTKMTFAASANALINDLAHLIGADRVTLGLLRGQHSRVKAVSQNATFKHRSSDLRAVGAAMDEAIEQRELVRYPGLQGEDNVQMTRAHDDLAERTGAAAILTAPLHVDGDCKGAITLERDRAFTASEIAMVEQLAALVTPSLEAKRENDRWLPTRAFHSVKRGLGMIIGPRHMLAKLVTLIVVAVTTFMALVSAPYLVSADAKIEADVRRLLTAPMEGFVDSATVRPGDLVTAGDVLATLDDSTLRLERVRILSERARFEQRYREAFATEDRAEARVVRAQIDGADARLALVEEQLARTSIVAPFDGVVIAGDLSQSLGSPIARGDVLFEIAPLDAYRVVLQVDEREISAVEPGQAGHLVLASLPDQTFAFDVEKTTPVSNVDDGVNRFQVEGRLDTPGDVLRPGMEGIGKIAIEDRKLLWIWTRKAIWWAKMTAWRWWPNG